MEGAASVQVAVRQRVHYLGISPKSIPTPELPACAAGCCKLEGQSRLPPWGEKEREREVSVSTPVDTHSGQRKDFRRKGEKEMSSHTTNYMYMYYAQ